MIGGFAIVKADYNSVELRLDGFGSDSVDAVWLSPKEARTVAAELIKAADALEKKNPEGKAPPG